MYIEILLLSIFFVTSSILLFWQGSLLFVAIFGTPTVYAFDQAMVDAFKLAKLEKGELVVDLGCGNAKSLIIAAKKFGAKGVGVEISPYCYLKSKWNVFVSGESKNVKIIFGDFKKAEKYLDKADVVYLYLLNKVLKVIEPWFFDHIDKDARVVSLSFTFDQKQPVQTCKTVNLGKDTKISLYKK
jgi:SAM-dependent methyltransferase